MQRAKLDDQDAKLAAFQQKYFGMLPEQEPSNMNTLQALTTQLDAATQSLDRVATGCDISPSDGRAADARVAEHRARGRRRFSG